jgi:hypothetical protein
MTSDYDYNASDSVHALSNHYNKLPAFEPNLNSFVLHARAKLTDLISVAVAYGGFLLSERSCLATLTTISAQSQLSLKMIFLLKSRNYKTKTAAKQ